VFLQSGSILNSVVTQVSADGKQLPTYVRSYILPPGRLSLGLTGERIYAAQLDPQTFSFGGGSFTVIPTMSVTTYAGGRQAFNLSAYVPGRTGGMFATPNTTFGLTMEWRDIGQSYRLNWTRTVSCLDPATPVMLHDGQQAAIGSLVADECVSNPITGAGMRIAEIINGPEPVPLFAIRTSQRWIKCSREHPIPTDRGFQQAERVKAGDWLWDVNGARTAVLEARQVPPAPGQQVYNLRFDHESPDPNDHMFLAGGVVVGDYWVQDRLREGAVREQPMTFRRRAA
jgi:hypothetical protein